jgi:hypothetical protein
MSRSLQHMRHTFSNESVFQVGAFAVNENEETFPASLLLFLLATVQNFVLAILKTYSAVTHLARCTLNISR